MSDRLSSVGASAPIRLGLRENLGQFGLLVVINAFVGSMMEGRTLQVELTEMNFMSAGISGVVRFGLPSTIRGGRKRLYRDPVPPRVRAASSPPGLQEVILRCLEVDPR